MRKIVLDNETELLEGLRNGAEHCYSALFNTLYPALCYHALQYTADEAVSEDIAEEAFIKLWERREHFFNLGELKRFLYVTVQNASIDWLRKRPRTARMHDELGRLADGLEKTQFELMVETELFRELNAAIETLPHQTRTVIKKIFIEGKKGTEVAEEMGVSKSTVNTLKTLGIRKLQNILPRIILPATLAVQVYL